jgi:hypothetical protein
MTNQTEQTKILPMFFTEAKLTFLETIWETATTLTYFQISLQSKGS